ncbi:MAG: hypothetical protein NC347_02090 [Clostridium sp.]|nr:hypothetical protein [Clostridium sp.]
MVETKREKLLHMEGKCVILYKVHLHYINDKNYKTSGEIFVLDKSTFLNEYRLQEIFLVAESKGLTWEKLIGIYNDYDKCHYTSYKQKAHDIVDKLYEQAPPEATIIYGRAKEPEHLLEKIIRKVGKEDKANYLDINTNNYRDIITDLIGVRILILQKEDWDKIDAHIHKKFNKYVEDPIAYVCYGDRDIFGKDRISTQYTNKGYRSQHYVVYYNDCICEIQVRTLAEEVYGEYDHKVRYPYRVDSNFLARYNRIISKVTSELDDLISTSLTLTSENIDRLDDNFSQDTYRDWLREVDENICFQQTENKTEYDINNEEINARAFAINKIMHRRR